MHRLNRGVVTHLCAQRVAMVRSAISPSLMAALVGVLPMRVVLAIRSWPVVVPTYVSTTFVTQPMNPVWTLDASVHGEQAINGRGLIRWCLSGFC